MKIWIAELKTYSELSITLIEIECRETEKFYVSECSSASTYIGMRIPKDSMTLGNRYSPVATGLNKEEAIGRLLSIYQERLEGAEKALTKAQKELEAIANALVA